MSSSSKVRIVSDTNPVTNVGRFYLCRSKAVFCRRFSLFVGAILVLFLFHQRNFIATELFKSGVVCFQDEQHLRSVVELVHTMDAILTEHNVTHWLSDGSLLGAVTRKGIIPWDHDSDFGFWYQDRLKIKNLIASGELAKHGIFEKKAKYESKFILHRNDAVLDMYGFTNYGTVKEKYLIRSMEGTPANDDTIVKVELPTDIWFAVMGCTNQFPPDVIFPLGKCEFSGKNVACPNKPKEMLKGVYCFSYGMAPSVKIPYKIDCYTSINNIRRVLGFTDGQ